MFKFIYKLLRFKNPFRSSMHSRHRITARHYIKNSAKQWSVFGIFLLMFMLTCNGATFINWEVSNVQSGNNVVVYGFKGDEAFRQLAIDSIATDNFSSFINNNTENSLGSYITDNNDYAKSIDFKIGNSTTSVSVFTVMFNSNNIDSYSFADITKLMQLTILKNKVNSFSFDIQTFQIDTVSNVPEPNISILLLLSGMFILLNRPREINKIN